MIGDFPSPGIAGRQHVMVMVWFWKDAKTCNMPIILIIMPQHVFCLVDSRQSVCLAGCRPQQHISGIFVLLAKTGVMHLVCVYATNNKKYPSRRYRRDLVVGVRALCPTDRHPTSRSLDSSRLRVYVKFRYESRVSPKSSRRIGYVSRFDIRSTRTCG